MRDAHFQSNRASDVLRSLHADRKLTRVVKSMAHEIARLKEDNLQLHASVKIYREIARRCNQQPIP
jgi:hypothetical protein